MATNLWEKEIDKTVDWGGDESTGGAKVSGQYVQKFIKDSLDKKFGYLYFDTQNLKYYIFADEADYNKWAVNPTLNTNLVLGSFDAPAPASITASADDDKQSVTMLASAVTSATEISFKYLIKDNSNNPIRDAVQMRISVTCNGITRTRVETKDADYSNTYKEGTPVSIKIGDMLQEGTNNITVMLTGVTSTATTSISFLYNIVNLTLSTAFDNAKAIDYNKDSFEFIYDIKGGGNANKYLDIFIDGNSLNNYEGLSIGNSGSSQKIANIPLKDDGGNQSIGSGKHSIQARVYVETENGTPLYSNIIYRDFVVSDPTAISESVYILYSQSIISNDIFMPGTPIKFSSMQYEDIDFDYSVYSSAGNKVNLTFDIDLVEELTAGDRIEYKPVTGENAFSEQLLAAVDSGSTNKFIHRFNKHGLMRIVVSNNLTDDKLTIIVTVVKSEANVEEIGGPFLRARFSALNRSNAEPEAQRATWSYNGINATFNNVAWNSQSGWINNTLTLTNGAQVTIPLNPFVEYEGNENFGCFGNNGMTFEIDLETFNAQEDDAVIMDFKANGSDPAISITATGASIVSGLGKRIKTNFMDNSRQKIAFIVNGTKDTEGVIYPNLSMIVVNGVLDRVINFDDSDIWTVNGATATSSFTIGNPNGEVNVRIHSIRIYRTALTMDEALTNYIADCDNIKDVYDRNNITFPSTTTVDADIKYDEVKKTLRTMVIYGELATSLNLPSLTEKGKNWEYDVLYTDPYDESRNFFARNAFISCQGTSSMFYPIHNLRLYFNKTFVSEGSKQSYGRPGNFDASGKEVSVTKDLTNTVTANTIGQYQTEIYPNKWFNQDDLNDYGEEYDTGTGKARKGIPYMCNAKTASNKKGFHAILPEQVEKINEYNKTVEKNNPDAVEQFYAVENYIDEDGKEAKRYVPCRYGDVNTNIANYYICSYRPITFEEAVERRHGGLKVYTMDYKYETVNGPDGKPLKDNDGNEILAVDEDGNNIFATQSGINPDDKTQYKIKVFSEAKKKKALSSKKQYYTLGGWWTQGDNQGATDKWTLKVDFAESSMTHNGGTGRFWGDCMKNVRIGSENGGFACRTKAQAGAASVPGFFDVRTSCFGKPIVIFNVPILKINDDGSREYSTAQPKFITQANIMTDKSSTPIFGFEDMYDENGTAVSKNEDNTFCFEGSVNGSQLIAGKSMRFDERVETTAANQYGYALLEDRPMWSEYEQRWPDPDNACDIDTYHLESYIRWMNFFKPAINYTIDGLPGYDFNPYSELTWAQAVERHAAGEMLYVKYYDEALGQYAYCAIGDSYVDDSMKGWPEDADGNKIPETVIWDDTNTRNYTWYSYNSSINYENVEKSINTNPIGFDIFIGHVPGYDANVRFAQQLAMYESYINSLKPGEEADWEGYYEDEVGGMPIPADDLKANNVEKYYVDVYLTKNGTKFYYTNEFGEENTPYTGSVLSDEYEKADDGKSYRTKTYMEYFSKSKYDHIDVYKVAAYYIYFTRFAGVDQVIKNTMTTTEDRKHFYFINYDNDTINGVRNDGILVFNWDVDRNTYDMTSGTNGSYSFAGSDSVFWNTLEMDDDFMNIVKSIDNAFYSQGLLTYDSVLSIYDGTFCDYWPERMYNKQEYSKYIIPFVNSGNTKYLNFCHGTRKSHRDWWLRNRFDLYDSKWQTGEYMSYLWKWYVDVRSANPSEANKAPLMKIVAASKYYFLCKTNDTSESDWFVELKAGESKTFRTLKGLTIGDPMSFVGPQKLREINFREGRQYVISTMAICEALSTATTDTWVERKGSLMTRFLIGDMDPQRQCGITEITGLDHLYTLEEVDLRYCINLPAAFNLSKLANLHIWRAEGSGARTFTPAPGSILYEVSLPQGNTENSSTHVKNSTTAINLTNIEFKMNPAEYVEASPDLAATYETVKGTADAFDLFKKSRKTGEYVKADGYSQNWKGDDEYDENYYVRYDIKKFPVWKYVPDASLKSVTIDSVISGKDNEGNLLFDSKAFVETWATTISESNNPFSDYTLVLKNIDWDDVELSFLLNKGVAGAPGIQDLIADVRTNFTGHVHIKDDLTDETYKALLDIYGDAFNPSSQLVFDANKSMFVSGPDDKAQIATEGIPGIPANSVFYDIICGDSGVYNASIFPVNADLKLEYAIDAYTETGFDTKSFTRSTTASGEIIYKHKGFDGIVLKTVNNKATLVTNPSYEFDGGALSMVFRISVLNANNNTENFSSNSEIGGKYIYIRINKLITPVNIELRRNNGVDNVLLSATNPHLIEPKSVEATNDEYEYLINFKASKPTAVVNVDIESINIEAVTNKNLVEVVSIYNSDKDSSLPIDAEKSYSFKLRYKMPTTETAQVSLKISAGYKIGSNSTEIYNEFNNVITVKAIRISKLELVDSGDIVTVNNTTKEILLNKSNYGYQYTFDLGEYNVDINSISIDFDRNDYIEVRNYDQANPLNGFTLFVKDNKKDNKYQSFTAKDVKLTISIIDKNGSTSVIEKSFNVTAAIRYPEQIAIERYDGVSVADTININLFDNQGTDKENIGIKWNGSPLVSITEGNKEVQNYDLNLIQYNIDVTSLLPGYAEPTVDYEITLSAHVTNENVPDNIKDNIKNINIYLPVINGSTALNNNNHYFYVNLPAHESTTFTSKIALQCTVKFDVNENGSKGDSDDEKLSYNTEIIVSRSYAIANTYTSDNIETIGSGKFYIIDSNTRYYTVETWHAHYDEITIAGLLVKTSSAAYGIALNDIMFNDGRENPYKIPLMPLKYANDETFTNDNGYANTVNMNEWLNNIDNQVSNKNEYAPYIVANKIGLPNGDIRYFIPSRNELADFMDSACEDALYNEYVNLGDIMHSYIKYTQMSIGTERDPAEYWTSTQPADKTLAQKMIRENNNNTEGNSIITNGLRVRPFIKLS